MADQTLYTVGWVYNIVRDQIEKKQDANVRWYDEVVHGEKSIMRILKMYSDKYRTG